jgi:VanZ family protein
VTRRLFLLIAFVVVAAALLFVPLPMPETYAGRTIENSGHTPLFLMGTLFILSILRHDFHIEGVRLYVLAGLIGAGAGVMSEVIQIPLQRDAAWDDVFADWIGVVLALALYALFDRRRRPGGVARAVVLLVVAGCLAAYAAPIVSMVRAYLYRDAQFPVLASFKSRIELYWIVRIGLTQELRDGALDVEFLAEGYPGVSFYEPVPDWRRFRRLIVDVENPDSEILHFGVRVHDDAHRNEYADRFNRRFDLAPGKRGVFEIPLDDIRHAPRNRLMNMAQISDVSVFRISGPGSRRMRLHNMRLD